MLSLKFVLMMGTFVIGLNIWDDASQGQPFDWIHIAYGFGFFAFAGILYIFMRLIFKFVLAKTLHDERKL
jgi:hypothetical protein